MPYLSLWTRVRWKLQQIHAEGIAGWLTHWSSRPFDLTDKAVLIVAPHQDDEAIGCGGLIALKREKNVPVYIVFLTNGSNAPRPGTGITSADLVALRRTEANRAGEALGVDPSCISFLNWPDSTLDNLTDAEALRLVDQLSALLQSHLIREVFVTHRRDCHSDHEAAYRLTRLAVLQSGLDIDLYQYSIWMLWSAPLFLRLRSRQLAGARRLGIREVRRKKQCAIQAHHSQCLTLPHGFLNRFRGSYEIFFHTALCQPE
jgi:LmbE family N-acetylglucosaminyl deacetylase